MPTHPSSAHGPDGQHQEFAAAKLILVIGDQLLVIRRDDRPDIAWPNALDFPGGGREAGEGPQDCALRETREEIGLHLTHRDLIWQTAMQRPQGMVWFYGARLGAERAGDIVFGNEGQGWMLINPAAYDSDPDAIPHFAQRLRDFMDHAG